MSEQSSILQIVPISLPYKRTDQIKLKFLIKDTFSLLSNFNSSRRLFISNNMATRKTLAKRFPLDANRWVVLRKQRTQYSVKIKIKINCSFSIYSTATLGYFQTSHLILSKSKYIINFLSIEKFLSRKNHE